MLSLSAAGCAVTVVAVVADNCCSRPCVCLLCVVLSGLLLGVLVIPCVARMFLAV